MRSIYFGSPEWRDEWSPNGLLNLGQAEYERLEPGMKLLHSAGSETTEVEFLEVIKESHPSSKLASALFPDGVPGVAAFVFLGLTPETALRMGKLGPSGLSSEWGSKIDLTEKDRPVAAPLFPSALSESGEQMHGWREPCALVQDLSLTLAKQFAAQDENQFLAQCERACRMTGKAMSERGLSHAMGTLVGIEAAKWCVANGYSRSCFKGENPQWSWLSLYPGGFYEKVFPDWKFPEIETAMTRRVVDGEWVSP